MSDHRMPTARELEVLRLIVEGLSDKEIQDRLTISTRTVHAHVRSLFGKTGTRTRTQLAVHALRKGIVPLNGDGPPPD